MTNRMRWPLGSVRLRVEDDHLPVAIMNAKHIGEERVVVHRWRHIGDAGAGGGCSGGDWLPGAGGYGLPRPPKGEGEAARNNVV